jgi:integrase
MTVFKRPERKRNPWCYKFKLKGELQKECGFRTQKEAQDAEAATRQKLLLLQTHTAFLQAVTKRLDYLQAYTTPGHYRDNINLLRHFSAWQDLLLIEITPEIIRKKLIEIAKEKGNKNANECLRALRSVFEQALNDGDLGRNPCRGLKMFPEEHSVKFIPSQDQIAAVLLPASALDQAYLTLIWQTAARVREINHLSWDDVDWERRQVRLWTRKKRGGHKTPRWVQLTGRAYDSLRYAWQNRDKNSPFAFTNPKTGTRYDYRDKFFHNLCRQAAVPEMGYHALRHQ